MGMKSMYELRDMLCKELDELIRKGELGEIGRAHG